MSPAPAPAPAGAGAVRGGRQIDNLSSTFAPKLPKVFDRLSKIASGAKYPVFLGFQDIGIEHLSSIFASSPACGSLAVTFLSDLFHFCILGFSGGQNVTFPTCFGRPRPALAGPGFSILPADRQTEDRSLRPPPPSRRKFSSRGMACLPPHSNDCGQRSLVAARAALSGF